MRFLPLLLLLGCAISPEAPPPEIAYIFTLDGKPYTPDVRSLRGTPDRPADGDVIWVQEFPLTLGPEKTCRFRTTPVTDGRLLLEEDDGTTRVVSIVLDWRERDNQDRFFVNPLATLSEEEVRGLRGLCINGWPDGTLEKLKQMDARRALLAFRWERGPLPPLPPSLRYLEINPNSGGFNGTDLSALGHLRDLRYLHLAGGPVDFRVLSGMRSLRHLHVNAMRMERWDELATLTELRQVEIYPQEEETFDSIEFAASLPHLKRFRIGLSRVRDLSPLSGLRDLVSIDVQGSPIRKLPDGDLPSLRTLSITAAEIPDRDAVDFATRHPDCKVLHRFARSVRERARGADLLRVHGAGPVVIEETDPDQIRALLDRIEVDDRNTGRHFCTGGYWLAFSRKNVELTRIRFDHGQCLNWHEWPHDGWLSPASSDFLCRWLDRHGIREPLAEFQKSRR